MRHPSGTKKARALRQTAGDCEQRLWFILRNRQIAGVKFRRQVPLGGYVLDFYAHQEALVIELDGDQHAQPDRIFKDEERTRFLESRGLRVIRFNNHEVRFQLVAVVEAIFSQVCRVPHPDPLPEGEGN